MFVSWAFLSETEIVATELNLFDGGVLWPKISVINGQQS